MKKLGVCVVFRVHNSLEKARLGITVKGKSNSVLRNKVKRQIREVFRLNQNKLGHFDYNVVVSGTVRVDYQTAEQVKRALEKIWSHEVIF